MAIPKLFHFLPLIAVASNLLSPVAQARSQAFPCDNLNSKHPCTFVLLDGKTNRLLISNKQRAKQRISPFSTFKIPNSLIALELGIVNEINYPITYNTESYPPESWWPKTWYDSSHSLSHAFKHSVVPIYRTLAMKIGNTQMQEMLNVFNYGNKDISSGIDQFWLDKSLKISAIEQVKFIKNVYERSYELKPSSYEKLSNIMLAEEHELYKIYAKTGGGQVAKNKAQGWYVGYVLKDSVPYYFAVNTDGHNFKEVQSLRKRIAKQSLKMAGII